MATNQTSEATRSEEITKSFGVIRKDNGLWFGGFNADKSTRWVAEESAKRMDRLNAAAQAALFRRFDNNVQRKPVAL